MGDQEVVGKAWGWGTQRLVTRFDGDQMRYSTEDKIGNQIGAPIVGDVAGYVGH